MMKNNWIKLEGRAKFSFQSQNYWLHITACKGHLYKNLTLCFILFMYSQYKLISILCNEQNESCIEICKKKIFFSSLLVCDVFMEDNNQNFD